METEKPIVLVLTRTEARVLASLMSHIAGNPGTTYRGCTDAIGNQLKELGFSWTYFEAFEKNAGLYALYLSGESNNDDT